MAFDIQGRGEAVIVRTYGGRPVVRFIWEARPAGFIVTEQPGDNAVAVGIPASDVFIYEEAAGEAISRGASVNWGKMQALRH